MIPDGAVVVVATVTGAGPELQLGNRETKSKIHELRVQFFILSYRFVEQ